MKYFTIFLLLIFMAVVFYSAYLIGALISLDATTQSIANTVTGFVVISFLAMAGDSIYEKVKKK